MAVAAGASAAADTALARALTLMGQKNFREAREVLQTCVDRDAARVLCHFNLGAADYSLDDFQGAAAAFRRVVELQSPLAPAARLYLAKSLRRSGNFSEAAAELGGNAKALPPKLAAQVEAEGQALESDAFERGEKAYTDERFEAALGDFEVAFGMHANPEVGLMKGMTLLQLGRSEEARRLFLDLAQGPDDVAQQARFFEHGIDEGIYRTLRPYWLSLDLSGGYNSDYLADGNNNAGQGLTDLLAEASYHFFQQEALSLRASYFLFWEEVPAVSSYRLVSHTLQSQLLYESGDWAAQLTAGLQYQELGSQPFLLQPRLRARVARSLGEDELALNYFLAKNIGQSSLYSYLRGPYQSLKAGWTRSERSLRGGLSLLAIKDSSGDYNSSSTLLPLANLSLGPELWMEWLPQTSLSLEARLQYLVKNYDSPAQPDGILRRDRALGFDLKATQLLLPELKLYAEVSWLRNASNLGATALAANKDYRQWIALAGLEWRLLP